MLPDSKIKTNLYNNNRPNAILTTNLRSSDIFRPRALSDYEKKKNAERKAIHDEIKRVSLDDIDI